MFSSFDELDDLDEPSGVGYAFVGTEPAMFHNASFVEADASVLLLTPEVFSKEHFMPFVFGFSFANILK